MFIRKRKNKGGTYSVMLLMGERIPGKKHVVSRMVKNFGAANTEAELDKLMKAAEDYKKTLVAVAQKTKTLKINMPAELHSCFSFNVGFADVYGYFFSKLFTSLPLKENWISQLRQLVVMRIAEPCSKRRTAQIASEYGFQGHVDTFYKLMDQLTIPVIHQVKKTIYEETSQLLAEKKQTIDVLFYDLTTLYFETNAQDELRDFGFSKDGKHQHVQIMLAIIVTKEGLPIDYEEFQGNSYEGHTLLPVIQKIQQRYHIDKAIIVADAALMNRVNLTELNHQGIQYIMAARIKNMKQATKSQLLTSMGYQTIAHSFHDTIKAKCVTGETGDTLFVYHSEKRARKDQRDREKSLEKISKYLHSTVKTKLTGCLKKAYVKVNRACQIEIDERKLALEMQYDGFFGLQTNIKEAHAMDILSAYRGLWQVEQTFRLSKNNLAIRPVFHYTPRRIKAHFILCFMALSLLRFVEFRLKMNNLYMPYEQWHQLLKRVRKVQVMDANKNIFELLEDVPPELLPAYQALGIPWHQKFQYKH